MPAYAEAYLNEVVENQGKLFDYFALTYPEMDTENFICTYMKSKTRQYIDKGQAYVAQWMPVNYGTIFRKRIVTGCKKERH